MAGSFGVNYNAGGVVDLVKKVNLLEEVDQVNNIVNVEVVQDVKLVDDVTLVEEVGNLKNVESVDLVDEVAKVDTVQTVNDVKLVDEVGKIRGFASKTRPYNTMKMYEVPALKGDYDFTFTLPAVDIELLAITLTCSGYGEDDHYDLFVNGVQWFKDWYCSEVKEGLFLGTSTYIYAAPSNSEIKLVFKNDSGTTKKVWLGVRMLI